MSSKTCFGMNLSFRGVLLVVDGKTDHIFSSTTKSTSRTGIFMPTQLSDEIFLSYRARSATTATFPMPLDDSIGNWKPTNRLGALKPLQTERNSKIPRPRKKYAFFFHSGHYPK